MGWKGLLLAALVSLLCVSSGAAYEQSGIPQKFSDLAASIGLLEGRQHFCTAFCVADDVVATAAHCLVSEPVTNLAFRKGGGDGARSRVLGESAQQVVLNTTVGTTRVSSSKIGPHDQPHYDWALLRLRAPICEGDVVVFDTAPFSELYDAAPGSYFSIFFQPTRRGEQIRFSWCDLGYRFDDIMWSEMRPFLPFPEDYIHDNCDAYPGASGSPVFANGAAGPGGVAIHSSHLDETEVRHAVNARVLKPYLQRFLNAPAYPPETVIRAVQELLAATGDYAGGVDGVFGRRTQQAILDFTLRHSLPVPSDRPTAELVPIIEWHLHSRPPSSATKAFEAYVYNPDFGKRQKAFAIDSGGGFGYSGNRLTLETATTEAMRDCARAGGRDCDLYAVNDHIVFGKFPARNYRRLYPTRANDPILVHYDLSTRFQNQEKFSAYVSRTGAHYKAVAVDVDTGGLFTCVGLPSWDQADRCARDRCHRQATRCETYAVGNSVVYGLRPDEISAYVAYYDAVLAAPAGSEADMALLAMPREAVLDPDRQFRIGALHHAGTAVEFDRSLAAQWYEKAALQGHVAAQLRLSAMYSIGSGVPRDAGEAIDWFVRSATLGDADAQYRLALTYLNGAFPNGVPAEQSLSEALHWTREAAGNGHVAAQYDLAQRYLEGDGVPENAEEGLAWLRKSAEAGRVEAQSRLGYLYAEGDRVPGDLVQAYVWLTVAADNGDADAARRLFFLKTKLTEEELDTALETLSEFR